MAREAGEEQLARDAEALGGRLFELSEFLVRRLGVEDVGASYPRRVTLHPTCHSQRVTRIGDAPQRLLAHVRGLELLELPEAAECCGFGGTFSIKNADVSLAMLADKCANILATGAEVVTAVDPSCLLHIGGGLSRLAPPAPGGGPAVRAVHLAQILAAEEQAPARSGPATACGGRRVSRAHDFPAAAREALADEQLRANLRRRYADDPRAPRRGRRGAARLGGAPRAGAARQGRRARPPRRAAGRVPGGRRGRRRAACTAPPTRRPPTTSSPASPAATASPSSSR